MPDYAEVLDAREAESAPTARGLTPAQINAFLRESARGAAVLTELLDSPAWNVFRSNVAGRLEPLKAERETLRSQIEAGALVGDDRARADLRLQYLRGAIEAYTFAMALPKALIEQHQKLDTLAGGNGGGADSLHSVRGDPRREHAVLADSTAAPVVMSAAGAARSKPRRKKKRS